MLNIGDKVVVKESIEELHNSTMVITGFHPEEPSLYFTMWEMYNTTYKGYYYDYEIESIGEVRKRKIERIIQSDI
jgi:hypothetical protein